MDGQALRVGDLGMSGCFGERGRTYRLALMTNPARRLQLLYARWGGEYGPQVSAFDARGLGSRSEESVELHLEAFRLLIAIKDCLDYLDAKGINVNTWRTNYTDWVWMVLHAPNNWQGGSKGGGGFPDVPMAHLDTLATLLDVDRPALHPEPEAKLRTAIGDVFDLLRDDDSISDHLREYVFKLANEIRTALDDESITGSFDFADAAYRLWVAIYAASAQSTKQRSKWKRAATDLFKDAAGSALGSLPALGLTVAQITAALG